ncbi:hypothetical protein FOS08_01205 [Bacillus pseudomycoides]|uniref:Uncharacterized protein n=1 Tax=Bacillus pseudomycoides TaxID=64104 RepID=A0AAJ1YWE1_9BACI|nr:hypothetical protein [Bacillus pseudomycoides]
MIFQHINCDYEEHKETPTHFLLLFSHGIGLKKALSLKARLARANNQWGMEPPLIKVSLYVGLSIRIYIN